jgi:hypothetical protein
MFVPIHLISQFWGLLKKLIHKITHWEAWPFKLIYAPPSVIWIYYAIRSRALWFFTPSNPKLTFGGMDGEPKKEMYDLLPKTYYPPTFINHPTEHYDVLAERLINSGIRFPLIVKPEVGGQGILFRKIDNEAQLRKYHHQVPVEYMVQEMLQYPIELSVFYIRHPEESTGRITGFLHKIPLQVMGDGKHTLEGLVLHHPKAAKRKEELYNKHKAIWHHIVPEGKAVILSYAANHNRGAHFIDLKEQIDPALVKIFDQISFSINDFFYGRYDIMCQSVEALKAGRDFAILEYNGCGAEPNHIYDTGYTLLEAYREILMHWKALFQISRFNARKGVKPWPFMKGLRFQYKTKALFRMMKEADKQMA